MALMRFVACLLVFALAVATTACDGDAEEQVPQGDSNSETATGTAGISITQTLAPTTSAHVTPSLSTATLPAN
jgi:hypothetical protein